MAGQWESREGVGAAGIHVQHQISPLRVQLQVRAYGRLPDLSQLRMVKVQLEALFVINHTPAVATTKILIARPSNDMVDVAKNLHKSSDC